MTAVLIIIVCLFILLAFLCGFGLGTRESMRTELRGLGFSVESSKLYHQAAKLLNSLVTITDLDGPMGEDVISDPTRARIIAWLSEYRRVVKK